MRCVLPRSRIEHDRSPRQTPDVGTGPFDGGHHAVVALREVTVLSVVYLLARAVHAHAQHLEQNASSVRNLVHPGSGRSARSDQETTTGTSKSRARQWNTSQACSACRCLTPLMSSRYRPGPRLTRMRALSHEAQRTIVPMSCP